MVDKVQAFHFLIPDYVFLRAFCFYGTRFFLVFILRGQINAPFIFAIEMSDKPKAKNDVDKVSEKIVSDDNQEQVSI